MECGPRDGKTRNKDGFCILGLRFELTQRRVKSVCVGMQENHKTLEGNYEGLIILAYGAKQRRSRTTR